MKITKRFLALTSLLTLGFLLSACAGDVFKDITIVVKDSANNIVKEATVVLTPKVTAEQKEAIDKIIEDQDDADKPGYQNFYNKIINKTDNNGKAYFRIYTVFSGVDVDGYSVYIKKDDKTITKTFKSADIAEDSEEEEIVFTYKLK